MAVTRKERFMWLILSVVLLSISLVFFQAAGREHKQVLALNLLQKDLVQKNTKLTKDYEKVQNLLTKAHTQTAVTGLPTTKETLVGDLQKHPELIPYKGVLGGKMGFYDPAGIMVLNSRWVFASFDDGHITGAMLLEYTVGPGGKISWKVLKSALD